jgi:hypothetical protein
MGSRRAGAAPIMRASDDCGGRMPALIPGRRRAWPPLLFAFGLSACAGAQAAPDAAGRWEGIAEIPGRPLRLVVDLDRDAQGRWEGSVILPGRGVKGVPLDALAVGGCDVGFALTRAFAGGDSLQPRMTLGCQPDGSLAGTFALGGQVTAVSLHRTGAAQVDRPAHSGVISAALAGRWRGRYEIGGVPREVTLTLANRDGAGSGQLVIVGKRTTTLVVDQVTQGREFVALRASAADFRIEGRFSPEAGVIDGGIAQGPFEATIVLRREPAAGEKAS